MENRRKFSRREFHRSWCAGLLAAVTGACSLLLARCAKTYPLRVVAHAGDVPIGGYKVFAYPADDRPCILLRPDDETYIAYSRLCTHNSCPVRYRPAQNILECPCHQGAFSAADGSVLYGPPPKPLPRVVLERRGDELVATGMKTGAA
jgi:nitrite reductase/ring-hydroxylating ferredoxin subunit